MTYTVMSDLHLEFAPLVLPGGNTLFLAGDVCVADYLREKRTDAASLKHKKLVKKFFFDECAKYNRVFYIAGNHEHYHGMYGDTHDILREFIKDSNVQFLDNETAELEDGVMLWAGTYWTDFNKDDWFARDAAKHGMNDFYVIHKHEPPMNPYRLNPSHLVDENKLALENLKTTLATYPNHKFIVMTHHCPSMMSSHPRYRGDLLNYAYCNTTIDNWIADTPQITHWLHGHTHDSWDYLINNCRVLCNPRGYHKVEPNTGFDPLLTFE